MQVVSYLGAARPAFSRSGAGGDLVHESPQSLILPFPLHQVSGHFRPAAATDLVHESPQSLILPSPLHQVSGSFWRVAGGDLVHESPQTLVLPFSLHQVSGPFWCVAGGDLVHESPQSLVTSFPLHQVSGHADSAPGPDRRAGLFLRLCFSSIYKKGIMKWPDWRGADSDEGKGRKVSNL